MAKSDRRAKRVVSDLVIELILQEGRSGAPVAGPVPAFLSNISPYGACLIVSQNQWEKNDSFALAHDYPRHLLFLSLEQPTLPSLTIPAKLVWSKLEAQEDDSGYYQLGVEFIPQPQEEAVRQFFTRSSPGGGKQGFWARLFATQPR